MVGLIVSIVCDPKGFEGGARKSGTLELERDGSMERGVQFAGFGLGAEGGGVVELVADGRDDLEEEEAAGFGVMPGGVLGSFAVLRAEDAEDETGGGGCGGEGSVFEMEVHPDDVFEAAFESGGLPVFAGDSIVVVVLPEAESGAFHAVLPDAVGAAAEPAF